MLTVNTRAGFALANDRLDAHFFTAPGVAATEQLAVLEAAGRDVTRLGDLARVWDPPRFARSYAAPEEEGVPYLRPYDVFDYLPDASDRLAVGRNRGLDRLVIKAGDLLQTCSGRNLGPVAIADEALAGLALSHDMIRISTDNADMALYLLAYLKTSIGQALLRRGRSGSVIDHITVADVSSLAVALPPPTLLSAVVAHAEKSMHQAQEARRVLTELLARYGPESLASDQAPSTHWVMRARDLPDRIDAGHYTPRVTAARARASRDGVRLGDLAEAQLPVRYKRYYVGARHGRAVLSGRQLLQLEPVNLRYVSDRSFKDPSSYELAEGMTVFGAVGRAEGKQGAPALVTTDRSAWLASNDVMRLRPLPGVHPGGLWLAVASADARVQINALSFGSVVDHMNPGDVEDIWVPSVSDGDADSAALGWGLFGESALQMAAAVALVDDFLVGDRDG